MKVVIPMSGMSSRFSAAGYTTPKFLIEVDGKTIIEHIIDLFPKDSEFIFVVNDIHSATTDIQQRLTDLVENKNICSISSHKLGPVHTVSQIFDLIEDDEQVIVNYCDFSMYWDYNKFENFVNTTECDGCVVCYTGFHPHMLGSDNYAFCKVNGENKILEIREKQPFTNDKMSEFASTGTYYFRKGSYVKKYFRDLIDRDININGEYYVSLISGQHLEPLQIFQLANLRLKIVKLGGNVKLGAFDIDYVTLTHSILEPNGLAITSAGTVMRTPAAEVRQTGRDSMGVRLVNLDEGALLLSVTKNSEDEIPEKSVQSSPEFGL